MNTLAEPAGKIVLAGEEEPLVVAARPGPVTWRELGRRLRAVTPAALVRFLLITGGLVLLTRILSAASAALVPFVVGAVLAYLLLPLVDLLERRLPRGVAILLLFTLSLIVFVTVIAYSAPAIAEQTGLLVDAIPDREGIQVVLDGVDALVARLPLSLQEIVRTNTPDVYEMIRNNVAVYVQGGIRFVPAATSNLLNTFSFLLGFLIVPIWLFYALKDAHRSRQALDRLLPPWMRADVWAIWRIVDRVLRNYVRGQLILSLVIGVCVFIGLNLLSLLGVEGIHSTLLLAIIAGLTESITIIGPLLGAIPAVLMGLLTSWQAALAVIILYVLIQQLENTFLVPLITGDTLDIHPTILILVLVVASQFGLLYMVLAAPLAALTRDLFLYVYGRLGDPPAPAGVLPGDQRPL